MIRMSDNKNNPERVEEYSEDHVVDLMEKKEELMKAGIVKVKEKNEKIRSITKLINFLIGVFQDNERVFLMGEGRSKLVGEAFAMRLRQMDFHAHVIGESTCPRVRKEDLVVVISGSGTTDTNVDRCETIVEKIKAKIVLVTSNVDSLLGRLSDVIVELPGRKEVGAIDYEEKRLIGGPILPLRTFFEALAGIFLDAVIEELMIITGTPEEKMQERHSI